MRKLFVAGNWKMNLDCEGGCHLAETLKQQVGDVSDVDIAVCPPAVYLKPICDVLNGSNIAVGGQNMHTESSGAFTGEVSGPMLLDVGCDYVIIGHSERRHVFGETDDFIAEKVSKALKDGIKPIVCVGETIEQREAGKMKEVVCRQVESALKSVDAEAMDSVTIAYEPVWAIGTGHTATPDQAEEVHAIIRSLLADLFDNGVAETTVIQYGGSVKPANATELLGQKNVDGALVGGASLTAENFIPIIEAAQKLS